jgi:hypothetical protein
VAVLGISLRRTMMEGRGICERNRNQSRHGSKNRQNQIPPLYKKLTTGGVQLRVNQVASLDLEGPGNLALNPIGGSPKHPPRLVARDISFSSSSRAADKQTIRVQDTILLHPTS